MFSSQSARVVPIRMEFPSGERLTLSKPTEFKEFVEGDLGFEQPVREEGQGLRPGVGVGVFGASWDKNEIYTDGGEPCKAALRLRVIAGWNSPGQLPRPRNPRSASDSCDERPTSGARQTSVARDSRSIFLAEKKGLSM